MVQEEHSRFINMPLNVISEIEQRRTLHSSGTPKTCPSQYITGHCEHGHTYIKIIYCGREWCPICGQEGSPVHHQRINRWLPKVFQIRSMGYFVFTIPIQLRHNYRDKKSLSILSKAVSDILRKHGFNRGLSRWHYFGDKSEVYHPHLNVIVDGSRIPNSVLRSIKRSWAFYLGTNTVVVNYEYTQTPGKKYHAIKYINRATFVNYDYDPHLAKELHNFRNNRYWGSWTDKQVWHLHEGTVDYESMTKFEKGICPFCGGVLHWSQTKRFDFSFYERHTDLLLVSPGYYLLL